jgi:hypothetical protein
MKEYLDIIRSVFWMNEDGGRIVFTLEEKSEFLRGMQQKDAQWDDWEKLIGELRAQKGVGVVDRSYADQRNAFLGFIRYGEPMRGIVFAISFPFGLYGFYYCKYERERPDRYIQDLSYTPFDPEMAQYRRMLEESVRKYFPDVKPFDNACAGEKIAEVIIEGKVCRDIDLWNAVLTVYDGGLY